MPTMTDTDSLRSDIARLAEQETRLQLPRLDAGLAWTLGTRLRELALARQVAVTIEIRIGADTVFFHAMHGTAPVNADWVRRKRNLSELRGQSSYHVGRQLERDGSSLEQKTGLPLRDYAAAGGSVPLKVNGTRFGTATVSGLSQRDDHGLVVEALAELCAVPLAQIALQA